MVAPLLAGDTVKGVMAAVAHRRPAVRRRGARVLRRTFAAGGGALSKTRACFNETSESLERQTATAEVLQAISGSVADPKPVFDIIAERAAKLTGAESGIVFRFDGELIHLASSYALDYRVHDAFATELPARAPTPSSCRPTRSDGDRDQRPGPAAMRHPTAPSHRRHEGVARKAGLRGGLAVPMFRDRQVSAPIAMYRSNPASSRTTRSTCSARSPPRR